MKTQCTCTCKGNLSGADEERTKARGSEMAAACCKCVQVLASDVIDAVLLVCCVAPKPALNDAWQSSVHNARNYDNSES